jgi:hypothetical protein
VRPSALQHLGKVHPCKPLFKVQFIGPVSRVPSARVVAGTSVHAPYYVSTWSLVRVVLCVRACIVATCVFWRL